MSTEELIKTINIGIKATTGTSDYFVGMRNGMRWALSLLDKEDPGFEKTRRKSILVINTPEKCFGCPCNSFNPQAKRWECDAFTLTKGRIGVIKMEEKPDWCPLRPLPEKGTMDNVEPSAYNEGFTAGRNHCIDLITGDAE